MTSLFLSRLQLLFHLPFALQLPVFYSNLAHERYHLRIVLSPPKWVVWNAFWLFWLSCFLSCEECENEALSSWLHFDLPFINPRLSLRNSLQLFVLLERGPSLADRKNCSSSEISLVFVFCDFHLFLVFFKKSQSVSLAIFMAKNWNLYEQLWFLAVISILTQQNFGILIS